MIAFIAAAAATAATPVTVPPQPELTRQVEAADAELFNLFFVAPCADPAFRAMITDDVEFYHDKDGFNVKSADEFMRDYFITPLRKDATMTRIAARSFAALLAALVSSSALAPSTT